MSLPSKMEHLPNWNKRRINNPTPFFLLGDDSSIWDDYSVSRRGSTRPTWRIYLSQKDNSSWVLFRSVFNCSSQLKRRPLLIADSHFDRPSVEKYSLCSPWFVITLGTRQKLKAWASLIIVKTTKNATKRKHLVLFHDSLHSSKIAALTFSDVIVMWPHKHYMSNSM